VPQQFTGYRSDGYPGHVAGFKWSVSGEREQNLARSLSPLDTCFPENSREFRRSRANPPVAGAAGAPPAVSFLIMTPDSRDTDLTSDFLSLFMSHQRELRNYLFSLHPHAHDLDDLFQETSLKLWQVFGEYDSTRPFLPWAQRIAYFQVLRLRKTRSRDRLVLSDELVELLAGEAPVTAQSDHLRACLNNCLEKLTPRAREVLLARYSEDTNIAVIARDSRQSVHALYRMLDKARSQVVSCLRRQLADEGFPPSAPPPAPAR
jgi:RNA polymerase sigma-70 factor (ECF subfamily)